jgi:hypothetical protein
MLSDLTLNIRSTKSLLENLAGNSVGSVILCFIFATLMIVTEIIYKNTPGRALWRRLSTGAAAIAFGVLISILGFVSATFFFKPTSINLDVALDDPSSGTLVTERYASIRHLYEDAGAFQLISGDVSGGNASWLSPEGLLRAHWTAPTGPDKFEISLTLYSGCDTLPNIDDGGPKEISYVFEAANSLDLWLNRGEVRFSTLRNQNPYRKFRIDDNPVDIFWINKNESDGKIELQQFVTENALLNFESGKDEDSFYISALSIDRKNDDFVSFNRAFHVIVDKKEYEIKFESQNVEPATECKTYFLDRQNFHDGFVFSSPIPLIGIFVKIRKSLKSNPLSSSGIGNINLSGSSGWIKVDGLSKNDLSHTNPGYLGMIEFKGNISNFTLDGANVSSSPISEYTAIGDLYGRFETSGQLRLFGTSEAFWRDGSRINRTRWELLSPELQVFFLTVFGGSIMFLCRIIYVRIKDNTPVAWISPR